MKNGWITFLKVISWSVFSFNVVIGIFALIGIISSSHQVLNNPQGATIIFGVFLGFVSLLMGGLIFLAIAMVFLNLAQDVSDIKAILKKRQY